VKKLSERKSKPTVTLSPFGRNKEVESEVEKTTVGKNLSIQYKAEASQPKFDWQNALVDGFIIAMITFFTTLGGVTATGANVTTIVVSSTISAVAQFFVLLAVKRGIKAPTTT
jgi:hypothetical protein